MKALLISLLIISSPYLFAQSYNHSKPKISHSVKNDKTLPLRDMKKIQPGGKRNWENGVIPNKEILPGKGSPALRKKNTNYDSAIQSEYPDNPSGTSILEIEGIKNIGGFIPPDTQGDVGLNHYIQSVNVSFAIWDKQGKLLLGPLDNSTLWDGFGDPWDGSNDGDPIVLYDQFADRWVFSQFALPNYPYGPFYELVAVSVTGDPTGSWYRYAFEFENMPDYPKFGIWSDGYYFSYNQFESGTLNFKGAGAAVIDREAMLNGMPAQMITFTPDPFSKVHSLLPSDADGELPPPDSPNYFMWVVDDEYFGGNDRLEIYEFKTDWNNLQNSSFQGPFVLETESFSTVTNSILQPEGTALDPVSDRLMYRMQYRNFGTHESIVANHTVETSINGIAGIRWYELRKAGNSWSIHQQSTYAPDNLNRWMGSIAMNSAGDIALGYSVSGIDVYPSIRYTGRLADSPFNQMTLEEKEIGRGTGAQTSLKGRWGDYSMMSVDPVDNTFWYTQEYYTETLPASAPPDYGANWKTRIAAFQFENDNIPPAGINNLEIVTNSNDPKKNPTSNTLTLTWTSPGDDSLAGKAFGYDLRYSADGPILSNINFENSSKANNLPLPGISYQSETYTLGGLTSDTEYWFAIKTVDESGNISLLSNTISGRTLNPPSMALSKNKFTSNLTPGSISNENFIIKNVSQQQSTLEFFLALESRNTSPSLFKSMRVDEEKLRNDKSFRGPLKNQRLFIPAGSGKTILEENFNNQFPPPEWAVVDNEGTGVIWRNNTEWGESNFTGGDGTSAVVNSDLAGKLAYDTELRSPEIGIQGYKDIYLSFKGNFQNYKGLDFLDVDISFDGGISWENILRWNEDHGYFRFNSGEEVNLPLDDIIGLNTSFNLRWRYYDPNPGDDWNWYAQIDDVKIIAGDISWFTLSPSSGFLLQGDSLVMNAAFNSTGLSEGVYESQLKLISNDPSQLEVLLPVNLTVKNGAELFLSTTLLEFTSVLYSDPDTASVTLYNRGGEALQIETANPQKSDYKLIALNSPEIQSIPPGDSIKLKITFSPSVTGLIIDTLTILSNDLDNPEQFVILRGNGIEPPVLSISADQIRDTLYSFRTAEHYFTITNSGQNDLAVWGIALDTRA